MIANLPCIRTILEASEPDMIKSVTVFLGIVHSFTYIKNGEEELLELVKAAMASSRLANLLWKTKSLRLS